MDINQQKIKELLKNKNIELFDFNLKILTNRINKIQKIFDIINNNVTSKNINIKNIKNDILLNTNIQFSNEEIFEISNNIIKKNNNINFLNYLENNSKKMNKLIIQKIFNHELSNIIYNITL